jgi:hypothetical protein
MQIPLYRNVVISMIVCLFFSTTSSSFILISIAFNCASIDTCTFVDGCTFTSTMFSSHAFIYIAYASIDYFSITSSSNSWMNTRYTDVVLGPICSFACQLFLLLMHKNSTIDGPILYILWIIVYANYIFSLYILPSSHFEDDGEWDGDLTTND